MFSKDNMPYSRNQNKLANSLTCTKIQLCQSRICLVWSCLDLQGIPSLGLHMLLSGFELQANGAVPCLTILLLFVGVVLSEMVQVLCSHLSESLSILSLKKTLFFESLVLIFLTFAQFFNKNINITKMKDILQTKKELHVLNITNNEELLYKLITYFLGYLNCLK